MAVGWLDDQLEIESNDRYAPPRVWLVGRLSDVAF